MNGPAPQATVRKTALPSKRSSKRAAERAAKAAALHAAAMPSPPAAGLEKVLLTPELAATLIERNTLNRPLSDAHVQRIAGQIRAGKWRFNGDTIKISKTQEVLDGQHRMWAVVEANQAVETAIVYGLERDAFATIDTLRRARSLGDTIALSGQRLYRNQIAGALGWLLRYQRDVINEYKMPENRVENSDIEAAFASHPGMARAIEATMRLRSVCNPAILGFAYYVMSNWEPEIADQMIKILGDPTATSINHPFFRLRHHFMTDTLKKKDPVHSIALIFKAATAAKEGREVQLLSWRNQGAFPEDFPRLAA